eukprot:CAMPEP_0118923124 /NCGR_PEP_ID=MMETSP1169-20130426/1771_1 /TAXON_ID=36882 /ORGANISM="Pyramimonas obovata, Strain CCMP722" /LENGTH=166 /DNA_ID=CAMNT_0006864069 /DNA_START=398 /DNA_END=898 /DNA_ORIENTATION=+
MAVPSDCDFMDFKVAAQKVTGVPVEDQKILFRGKPMNDGDALFAIGVRDGSKLMLIESEARRRAKVPVHQLMPAMSPADAATLKKVHEVQASADKLEKELVQVESDVAKTGTIDAESKKQLRRIQEMLERELLKLDSLSGEGIRDQRRAQVQRINALCERTEALLS